MSTDVDIAVIGAGPAGMTAASTAAEAGLSCVLLDEQAEPGGQIYRAIERLAARGERFAEILGEDYARGAAIAQRFRQSGAVCQAGVQVFDLDADGVLGLIADEGARWIRARRVIVAAGAQERPVPVPGWTLPGVMSLGSAQTLLKSAAMVSDVPTVIAGSGPLLYLAATQLIEAGARIEAVLDTMPRERYLAAAAGLPRALMAGGELRKGLAWKRRLKNSGVRYLSNADAIAIAGEGRVTGLRARVGHRDMDFACSLVLLHEGVVPNVQLAMVAGARHDHDGLQACWRPVLDPFGRTTVANILVAGDAGGIGGAELAAAEGELAACAAAYDLGCIGEREFERRTRVPQALVRRKKPLRRFLDTLFRPRDEVLVPPGDDTIVCRCEEVTAGELRRIAALGCTGPNQSKAFSRAGMGPCQGRMCALTISHLLAAAHDRDPAHTGHLRLRPPVKPVTVGQMAGAPDDA
ncbi:MAG: FAD-dependent oxidoreductase [Geminicoccaceae bacterium]|nr:FAD-dependent oxidoreductase [Geminicoccaceae bacterium]